MNISKDRLLTEGKERIAKRGGDPAAERSFVRKVLKEFGEGKSFQIGDSPTICICGKPLNRNNSRQLQKYCSKECRKKRHNKERE
jgi:hypothetical protein